MQPLSSISRRFTRTSLRIACILLVLLFIYIWKRSVINDVLILLFGSAAICFLIEPLSGVYEQRLPRRAAVLFAMFTFLSFIAAAAYFLLPRLISEASELLQMLPESLSLISDALHSTEIWISSRIPGFSVSFPSMAASSLPSIAMGTISFAGGIASFFYRLSLMFVLAYFFLCDRERLFILLELMIPRSMRQTAVKMGNSVCSELKAYLRGQGMISLIVGLLTAAGLAAAGIRSALTLGTVVGVMNMIPYFGPIIGSVPAVMTALVTSPVTALKAIAVLWLVQQIDSTLISPRIMGGIAGISPAAVLLAVFIGSGAGGIVGMLLALPVVMAFRTVFRVFVQRYKNV